MKSLDRLYQEALGDVIAAGIIPGKISSVTVSSRFTRALGKCHRKSADHSFQIKIAAFLLDEEIEDQVIKNTIAHEILHTVKGCFNHGEPWKREARKMTSMGYDITRLTNTVENGIKAPEPTYRYSYRCKGCGIIIRRSRKSRFTENYMSYLCGRCGGHFEEILP